MVDDQGVIGAANYKDQCIYLDVDAAPEDTVAQAYYHELIHWIFFIMNEEELRNNEKLVDTMAHLLYQALKTAEIE